MKKKKLMTKEDKRNYFLYQFKTEPLGALGDLIYAILYSSIIAIIILLIIKPEEITKIYLMGFIACVLIIYIITYILSASFKVRFLKDIYIIDGHISKNHMFRGTHDSPPVMPKAKAISEDGGVSTKWIYYPKKYFKKGKAKAKIIIYKNKAIDFYLVD